MAGARFLLWCAAALAVAGGITVPIVARDASREPIPAAVSPSTTEDLRPGQSSAPIDSRVTAAVRVPAKQKQNTTSRASSEPATDPCRGAKKHEPMRQGARFSERGDPSRRRVLATGSFGRHAWRLAIEPDRNDDRLWNLTLAHSDGSGSGGSGGDASGAPFNVSGTNIDRDGWAYYGKAANDSACVVVTTGNGLRVVTDEFFTDAAYPDGKFFIAFLSCRDAHTGATLESFDRGGTATATERIPAFGEDPGQLCAS